MMHRIGIISDTHGLLRPEVTEALRGCGVILHGGDINKPQILDELNKIAPTCAVRGNNDKEWAKNLPETLSAELYGVRFFMVHNKKYIPKNTDGIDIIVYGHSHKYEEHYAGGQLLLNPGSCGPRRFTQPITFAVLTIEDDRSFHVEKIEIAQQGKGAKTGRATDGAQQGKTGKANKAIDDAYQSQDVKTGRTADGIQQTQAVKTGGAEEDNAGADALAREISALDMKRIVKLVMRDTDRKLPVKEIAVKNSISEDLAEQICRLYLTHPGVSADGILGKMGL